MTPLAETLFSSNCLANVILEGLLLPQGSFGILHWVLLGDRNDIMIYRQIVKPFSTDKVLQTENTMRIM